jgi:hypothetical protein
MILVNKPTDQQLLFKIQYADGEICRIENLLNQIKDPIQRLPLIKDRSNFTIQKRTLEYALGLQDDDILLI